MDKRVILAVAGSGKTYYLCNNLDPEKKNLVLAFTHENVGNLLSELVKAYGKVPELTSVMTFDAFMYRLLLKPYEYSIPIFFDCEFVSKGITTINAPSISISRGKRNFSNPNYVSKDCLEHYVTETGYYYCDRLAELILQVKIGKEKLVSHACKKLNDFFDGIYIDEFQDYRKYDYDLLMKLTKYMNYILLVGDYYQHSVSGTNNSGRPFSNKKTIISYNEFITTLEHQKFEIDNHSLSYSRRCSVEVCDFVRDRLGIEIYGNKERDGKIIIVKDIEEARKIIEDNGITKLVYQNATKCPYYAVNWSYSKGDTMKSTCVILGSTTEVLLDFKQKCNKIAPSTLNKLYVALTRATGDVYIISSKIMKKLNTKI